MAEGKHKTYTYDITWDILDGYLKTLPIGVGLPTWAAIHIGCCRGAVQNAIKRLNFPTPGRVRSAGSEKPSHTAYAAVKRTACVVCGETRVIDAAHIVPRSKGGSGDLSNIAPLCPTHHRCFDRGLLTATEQTSLDTYLESRGIPPEREPVCS